MPIKQPTKDISEFALLIGKAFCFMHECVCPCAWFMLVFVQRCSMVVRTPNDGPLNPNIAQACFFVMFLGL